MAERKNQWHPLLADLLRKQVERYYELLTEMPVGDLPRRSDFVLLRRVLDQMPPFRGLWRFLTVWNVLEFKGPTVRPRPSDLANLVELGLGIARRLNKERAQHRQPPLPASEITFWFVANRLGNRIRAHVEQFMGPLEQCGEGVWRGYVLGHPCLFVSTVDLPVEEDSIPLHLLSIEPLEKQREVGKFVLGESGRLESYGRYFAAFHEKVWKEFGDMASSWDKTFDEGVVRLVNERGISRIIRKLGTKKVLAELGTKEVIEQLGTKEVIEQLGTKEVLARFDADDLLANVSPATMREVIRRASAKGKKN